MIINSVNNFNNINANSLSKKDAKGSLSEANLLFNSNSDLFEKPDKNSISTQKKIYNLERIENIKSAAEDAKYKETISAYEKMQRQILIALGGVQNGQKAHQQYLEEKAYYEDVLANDCILKEGKFLYDGLEAGFKADKESVENLLQRTNELLNYCYNPKGDLGSGGYSDEMWREDFAEQSSIFAAATGMTADVLDPEKICTGYVGNTTPETFMERTNEVIEKLKEQSRALTDAMVKYEQSRDCTESKEESKNALSKLQGIFEKQKRMGVWESNDYSLLESMLKEREESISG